MIEERIGEVRVRVRTDLPDAAQIRTAAERIVRVVLERCAAMLEERVPGRVVLIRRLPLRWRVDETVLDEPARVEELAQSAADTIERTVVPWRPADMTSSLDLSATRDAAVLFDDEAHLRAWSLLGLARGQPAWFHAAIEESETGNPLAALTAPEHRSIAPATLVRLAREGVLAEVLAAHPVRVVAALAAALGCDVQQISPAQSEFLAEETAALESVDRPMVAELAAAASRWPALMPAAQALALRVHAAVLLGIELAATKTIALAAAALQAAATPRELDADAAPQDQPAAPDDDGFLDEQAHEEPSEVFATRCAGLFYLLDRIQELDLAESLWKACLPEGDVLAAAASALLGSRFAGDAAPALFGGVGKTTRCPKVTLEQHSEVVTATCAALAAALPRRGLAEIPRTAVRLVEHPAGTLLVAAAEGSPFAFFAWPAPTPELLRAGLGALLGAWPHRGPLDASPALVTLDSSGRLRPLREGALVSLLLPTGPSAAAAALLAITIGAPAMLFAARAGDATNNAKAFVAHHLARPGRIQMTSDRMEVILRRGDIDLDVRRAALDRDPGWLPWLRRTVRVVFEDDASAEDEQP